MRRHARVLIAVVSLVAFLSLPAAASAAPKTLIAELGTRTSFEGGQASGGLLKGPQGVAVNQTGNGGVAKGTVYVVDVGNFRIQQFSPGGAFVRAWGAGVLSGNSVFESCSVAIDCGAGIATALAGGLSPGGSAVAGIAVDQATGLVYVGDPGNTRIDVFTASGSFQGAFGFGVKANAPASALQLCTITTGCKAGTSGTAAGQLNRPQYVAVGPPGAPNAGDVFVADTTQNRVNEFKPLLEGGALVGVEFVRGFGWGVDTGASSFQVCTTESACQGSAGTGTAPGQFGAESPTGVAVDSEGNVFALDAANKRIEMFDSTPAPVAANFGAAAVAATFGTGAPKTIAIDSSSAPNHLLVAGARSAAEEAIAVLEVDHAGVAVATHGTELSTTQSPGLAAAPASLAGNVYLSSFERSVVDAVDNRVYVLGDKAIPTIEAATAVTANAATLHGQVVSNNAETSYRFEYSADGGKTWGRVPSADVVVAPQAGNVPVEQVASGLVPNTAYLFRLVSTRPVGGFGFTSAKENFTTLPAAPLVPDVSAVEVGDVSARLVGQVNPNHSLTSYVFEYGTSPSFGSATASASAGSGSSTAVFSQLIGGLAPNTTYYYRLVATNSAGSTPGPTRTFVTRATPLPLPDERAYEMVSPPDKSYGPADGSGAPKSIAAWDGEAVDFCTSAQFGEEPPQATTLCVPYLSERGPSGWETRAVFGAHCQFDPSQAFPQIAGAEVAGLSPDLGATAFRLPESPSCPIPPLDPAAPLGTNLYRGDFSTDPPGFDLLAPKAAASPQFTTSPGVYGGASDDFGHVVYTSNNLQTIDATGTFRKVFDWDHGTLKLVSSQKPDGTAITTASGVPSIGEFGASDGLNVVSSDGSRIFFQNPTTAAGACTANTCELYMREGGTTTNWVSQQECTVACSDTSKPDLFEWATPNGEKALFLSEAKLVDGDASPTGRDLYRYVQGPNPSGEKNLSLLSQDNEPLDGTAAEVRGVLGISDDGNTVYFAANGQIVAGKPTTAGAKVYRWRWNGGSPSTDYLATLAVVPSNENGPDGQNWAANETGSPAETPPARLVTPDGEDLLIETVMPLDSLADHDSDRDVYRWTQAAGWTCLSCQALGVPSAGQSSYDAQVLRNGATMKREGKELRTVMSDDGQRIFFASKDRLVTADANDASDVYEWHDGRVLLISSGTGSGATLLGASRSGRDVFFYTNDKLVGWDTDPYADVYDARTGGGFPEPPAEVKCEDDACQGTQSPVPAATQPGTVHPSAGNGPSGRKRARCTRRHKAKHKKAHKRSKGAHRKQLKAKHSCKRRPKS